MKAANHQPWRTQPGFLRPGQSSIESIQTLIGDFLHDRDSPHLLNGVEYPIQDDDIQEGWGKQSPLEKVVKTNKDLRSLLENNDLLRHSLCILEPADHVGHNSCGETVRASLNVACLAQGIADCDSILFPLWDSPEIDRSLLLQALSRCMAVVVEGGHPTVREADTFKACQWSLQDLQNLCEELIISRQSRTPPVVFICLGHQLAAQAHIHLIQKATRDILNCCESTLKENIHTLKGLLDTCKEIESIGRNLKIIKGGKDEIAHGWDDPQFAVGVNEIPEAGHCELVHYDHNKQHPSHRFSELILTHAVSSEEYDGIIEHSISYEKNLNIVMFHTDEVNEEAILFANWAYRKLHHALVPARKLVAISPLAWLLKLPSSVEILCSTTVQGKLCTEVAATCISYMDFETKNIRRSFSCQFHPELLDDLREFSRSGIPAYSELKKDDGIRLLMRILYEAIKD